MGLEPTFCTTREIARLIGVRPSTIWRWHTARQMPAAADLPGRSLRWRSVDIETWLAAQHLPGATADRESEADHG